MEQNDFYTTRMQQLAVDWSKIQPQVTAYLSSIVRDHHDTEDLLQRTAAAAAEKYSDYDQTRPFIGWVLGLARIEIMRYRQSRQRDRMVFSDDVMNLLAEANEESTQELMEMREYLEDCINKLQGKPRQIMEVFYLKQLSLLEISRKFNMKLNAVKVALHRARVALRNCMEKSLTRQV